MEIVTILLKQVLIMYILIFLGYYSYKKGLISDQGSKDIGKILLNVAIPAIVISNFCVERTPDKVNDLLYSMIISVIGMLISILVALLVFHKKNRIDEFSVAFSNAGFIGIPLVQATFGNGAVFYISMMIVLVNVLQWTYGVYTITDDKKYMSLKAVITNPVVISVLIGTVLFFGNIRLPEIASSVLTSLGNINSPLAMFVSGVYLAQSNLVDMVKKKDVYFVSFVRLIVVPLICIIFMRFVPFGNRTLKLAILLALSAPVGSNVAIFASQYDKDYRKGIENVCVSTLLCVITLPIMMYIASVLMP